MLCKFYQLQVIQVKEMHSNCLRQIYTNSTYNVTYLYEACVQILMEEMKTSNWLIEYNGVSNTKILTPVLGKELIVLNNSVTLKCWWFSSVNPSLPFEFRQ